MLTQLDETTWVDLTRVEAVDLTRKQLATKGGFTVELEGKHKPMAEILEMVQLAQRDARHRETRQVVLLAEAQAELRDGYHPFDAGHFIARKLGGHNEQS